MKLLPLLLACALVPAAAHAADPARCVYTEVARMPLRYVGEGLAPAIVGTIEGMPATMLVDTGAYDTHLTMNGANKRGLELLWTGRHAEGVGGSARVYGARVNEMTLGSASSKRSAVLFVMGDTNLTPAFDAILGAPYLLQADLEVDLRARQIRFFRARDCGKANPGIWQENAVALPFERSRGTSPNPHFTVTVNGKKLDAAIDTGAHGTVITADAARRIGIDIDGTRARRQGYSVGIGTERAGLWSATFDSVVIGTETIRNAELGIIDTQGELGVDMLLGRDFLRTHRVLFAMSQKTLYIADLGGDPFGAGNDQLAWIREEAGRGNPDAQFALAMRYEDGRGVARDRAEARSWMDKAAAGGEPHAVLQLGRRALLAGHALDAIAPLRTGLDLLPAHAYAPLWLYLARMRNGETALAASELQANLKKQQQDGWPQPIAAFYLGKLDAAGLLAAAGKDKADASGRSCQSRRYMAEWHGAHGDMAQADALMAEVHAHCQVQQTQPQPQPQPDPTAS